MYTLAELCRELSITPATGRNWIKLGKLKPTGRNGRSYIFSEDYVEALKLDLKSGKITALKSRRNKGFVSGSLLYEAYVSTDSPNLNTARQITQVFASKNEQDFSDSSDETALRAVLSECALSLTLQRISYDLSDCESLLKAYLEESLYIDEYAPLLDALIGDKEKAHEFIDKNSDMTGYKLTYVPGEDTLGLIYISLKHLGNRKNSGAYFTPGSIVQRLLGHMFEAEVLADGQTKRILDPGCGTGNFLLCLPPGIPVENLYGYDTDEISVLIARINLALKYKLPDIVFWEKHISQRDFLSDDSKEPSFDIVIGNPPWGSSFSEEDEKHHREAFDCAQVSSLEAYDLFVEQAVRSLTDTGILSFILPESILGVRSHSLVRRLLMQETVLSQLDYLGEVFGGVQCPSIILQVEKLKENGNAKTFLSRHPSIYEKGNRFTIEMDRDISEECFDFLMTDEEYAIIKHLESLPGAGTLMGNADFALGIVTGANKNMLKTRKSPKNEIILKGSDIYRYTFKVPKCYINFDPKKCQQVAPLNMYRAPEKLLYRFIGSKPVFAYDDKQTLSLNSCNILIPRIDDLGIKYIMAILNCSVTEYFYRKKFRSVKLLRSHIEQFPIPYASPEVQGRVTNLADRIIELGNASVSDKKDFETPEMTALQGEIDKICLDLYDLSESQKKLILDFTGSTCNGKQ